ncbi:fucose-binding lectin II [Paraburkholderia sp. 22099]|jgi:hypothetical protein|uniref:Calcium-mediated lectin domain-containing protein n=1 Tax=Paraburkholderia terricola TaxID=169427 RepID=A0ABU1LKY5_9BURK|nr:fucose-binding lectin II [Paraburkholderia terricola]MDR6407414.1 hypothetical protein [Paraburkholderia terricola]MDR6480371.1 hypothetical protein [Paraburkholderia terricola]MDR6493622.1 hypothetical protein [Paraburkholderia terricola]
MTQQSENGQKQQETPAAIGSQAAGVFGGVSLMSQPEELASGWPGTMQDFGTRDWMHYDWTLSEAEYNCRVLYWTGHDSGSPLCTIPVLTGKWLIINKSNMDIRCRNATQKSGTYLVVKAGTIVDAYAINTNDETAQSMFAVPGGANPDQTTKPYVLPHASATVLGGIKVGQGLEISADGTLSVDLSALQALLAPKTNVGPGPVSTPQPHTQVGDGTFKLPPGTRFSVTALAESTSEQTVEIYVGQSEKPRPLSGPGADGIRSIGTTILDADSTGIVRITVSANGKPSKIVSSQVDIQPSGGKTISFGFVGSDDGTRNDNDYNAAIVFLSWPVQQT